MFGKLFTALAGTPVARERDTITRALVTGEGSAAVILSAETGSGKSLITPPSWAKALVEKNAAGTYPVVVCVPRVFLAINNAETVAELAGLTIGREVGYATGEGKEWGEGTRLLFATYGSALAAGLIGRAHHIVFDEVHEGAMDISVARALVHRRIRQGEHVRVLEMSATLNEARQHAYWARICPAHTFSVAGSQQPCELRQKKPDFDAAAKAGLPETIDGTTAYEAVRKIVEENRRGVLIFRPGIAPCEETAALVAVAGKHFGRSVRGAAIHGSLDSKERTRVVQALADGEINVLVGTNVIESGVNLKGVDAAVSCGMGKIVVQHPDSGALWLDERPLPQWRLTQQAGRVRRFSPGIFTLLSDVPMNARPVETEPEIARLPLRELVTTCAGYRVRAHELEFDVAVDSGEIEKAERELQVLEIIDKDGMLTPEGEFGKRAPVDSEGDSMLWEAKRIGILGAMIVVVALMEEGGIRARMSAHLNVPLTADERKSDWLAELAAFNHVERELAWVRGKDDRKALFESLNVSQKKYWGVKELVKKLRRALARDLAEENPRTATCEEIRRCILAGEVNTLVSRGRYGNSVRTFAGADFALGRSSVVELADPHRFAVGELRRITSREGRQFTFFTNVTAVSLEDLRTVCPYLLREENGCVYIFGHEIGG